MQAINLEEKIPPKESKIREIGKMLGKVPKSYHEGDPKAREVKLTNVEITIDTQEERVKVFSKLEYLTKVKREKISSVRIYFSHKIHNEMLAEALLRKGACSPIYDEVGEN